MAELEVGAPLQKVLIFFIELPLLRELDATFLLLELMVEDIILS